MAIVTGKKDVEDMLVENQPWNITAKVKVTGLVLKKLHHAYVLSNF